MFNVFNWFIAIALVATLLFGVFSVVTNGAKEIRNSADSQISLALASAGDPRK